MAHVAAGGGLVLRGASYSYETGPDGQRYAVGGEVTIDTSEGRTPQETLDKAARIQAAALAPADTSSQDRQVAAMATRKAMQATMELASQQAETPAAGDATTTTSASHAGRARRARPWAGPRPRMPRCGWAPGLRRDGDIWRSVVEAGSFRLDLAQQRTQPLLRGRDTLYLKVHNWSPDPLEYFFILDSLDPQFMILRDTTGQTVYRKVPYGTNAEGIVLNGFMGTLDRQLNAKEYRFDLPSAKRIKLELKSAFAGISFRVFDGEHELTAAPVKSWDAILIRSGQYRAVVAIDDPGRLSEDRIEFDLKVYGY